MRRDQRDGQEIQENLSYGARAMRDGVSLNPTSKTTPLILPTEIGSLQGLEAYLKLPGSWPITKLRMRYKNLKSTDALFIETTSYYPDNRNLETVRINDSMNQEI